VFWYGGVWTKGSKEQYRFVGASLARSGYVAILPDYRLYPQVRFPQFVEDGALAVRWAQQHAAEFGGNAHAVFLMGHSAGAHIAALVALDPRYLRNVGAEHVLGWIGISGPYALNTDIPGKPILREIFRAPYTAADWQVIATPGAHSPRTLLLHGTDDLDPRDVVSLAQKLRAGGAHVECHIYQGVTHMMTVAALSVPLRGVAPSLADVRDFIDQSFSGTGDLHEPDADPPCPELRFVKDTTSDGMRAEVLRR
jgi:acetyl esterase/lipase